MKKRNMKTGRKMLSAVLATAVMAAGAGLCAQAELKLDGLGDGQNQIAALTADVQGDLIALDDQGISVQLSEYTSIYQEDGFVYVYMDEEGYIPYVIIGYYDTDTADFADQFTEYMRDSHSDLQVTAEAATVNLGGRSFTQVVYAYAVSGYTVRDTRLFAMENGRTYMFGAKEIPQLSCYVGSALEQAAGSFAHLAGGDSDYPKHVDSERSVKGGAKAAVDDIEQAVDDIGQNVGDVAGQESSDAQYGSGGTVGTIGTMGGVMESAGNTEGSSGQDTETGSIVFEESVADYAGTWVPFQDGFQLYLPSDWSVYELTEEQTQQGVLYLAGDASGAEYAPAVSVVWAYSDGAETLEDIAAAITQAGYQVDGIVTINGIGCITYRLEAEDCSAIMFFHPTNRQYVFCVTGTQYAENVDTICSVLTSLSLYTP
ncbi:MAG: hypothetical protein Q4C50_06970 [Eubacteriales bacterium]|nr:hypothetical protein [Eubacteriales bacterium]